MAAKKATAKKATAKKAPAKTKATASKAPAKKAPAKKKIALRPEPPAVVKKPKKPAKANKMPATPIEKTIHVPVVKPPPKPKATISRAKAVQLANAFLKENVGKAALYAPRASRFRVGNVIDKDGIINVLFCHEGDDGDPAITSLGPKCIDAMIAAHPQLKAFEIEQQTIKM